jgi:nicotinamide-nucleotide adenylyltransferase
LAKRVGVDVGVTTTPYYTDKSVAIASTNQYPDHPKHIHIVGYDTLIRIANPKYYPSHSPPLSALGPFFSAGHGFLTTQRPYDPSDESSKDFGTEQEQTEFLDELRRGGKEELGFKSEWTKQIQMLPPGEGQGVSSSRIRAAVKAGRWDEAGKLCTPSVLQWVRLRYLYQI